jgi:hypothetical protein
VDGRLSCVGAKLFGVKGARFSAEGILGAFDLGGRVLVIVLFSGGAAGFGVQNVLFADASAHSRALNRTEIDATFLGELADQRGGVRGGTHPLECR